MIDYVNIDLFNDSSVDKQFLIVTDDNSVAITNTELHQGEFELEEKLCDENNLVFGLAEPSKITFTASNVFSQLKNKWLTVYITLNHDTDNSFKLGRFKVYSDVPTADRKKRTVTAYDALYDILQADVANWYNGLLPDEDSIVTMREFRDSFFAYFQIEQEEIDLINDDMTVEKTIQPEELSGKTVINAICEINGCFGHIGRNGKFKYIYLAQSIEGLYPAQDLYPSENLYPRASDSYRIGTGTYIPPLTYENYTVKSITGLQIRQEENDLGAEVGTSDNLYVIEDNFLVYGKGADELKEIALRILEKIKEIVYRPFSTSAKGNPCIEVGDSVRLNTNTQRVESYVFQRVLKGIQALRDTYTTTGNEYLDGNVNSVARSIKQLKGKTSELTRTADEIKLSVTDLEKSTSASLSVLSDQINLRVTSGEVESMISVALDKVIIRAEQIRLEGYTTVNGYFAITEDGRAVLHGDSGYTATMAGQSFSVSSSGKDQAVSYMFNGILCRSGGSTYRLASVANSGITLGIGNSPILNVYTDKINGSTPITESNLDSYVKEVDGLVTESNVDSVVASSSSVTSLLEGLSELEARVFALEQK